MRFLLGCTDYERMRTIRYDASAFKLDRMRQLMEAWGNPHEQVRLVHVAGSVGKGSTVAMIAALFSGCGYTVGEFTSPHLVDVRERITINQQQIGKAAFTELVRQVTAAATKLDETPTFFELMTAIAFKHFADEVVDVAII